MKLKRERLPADPRFFALSIKKVFAFFGRRANGSRVFFPPGSQSLSLPLSLFRAPLLLIAAGSRCASAYLVGLSLFYSFRAFVFFQEIKKG